MTTTTSDLADFLLARIAEDEAEAGPVTMPWRPTYADTKNRLESTHDGLTIAPERVLAECEAKRRIVEMHHLDVDRETGLCIEDAFTYPCETVRILATVYADHPDYRDEWKP